MNSNPEKKSEKASLQKILLSVGSITILVLAAISFIFLPAMMDLGQKTIPPLGKYKGKPITYAVDTYFTKMLSSYAEQERQNGREVNESNNYELFNNAFKATVLNIAFTDEVKASKYIVPDNLIDRTMIPYFYDENGVYSPKRFREYPASKKTMLRKQIAEHLAFQRYYFDYVGANADGFSTNPEGFGGVKKSSKEIPFIAKLGAKERSFDIVAFSTANYPESEAILFAKENPTLFVEYDFSLISLDSEATAKSVSKQLNNAEILFEDAVTEFSTKNFSDETGKLKDNFYFQIKNLIKNEKDIEKITTLEENAISTVIETSSGFSIFRLNKKTIETDFTKQTVIDAVISYMTANESGIIEDYFIARAKDFSSEATKVSFDSACDTFDVTKTTTTPFSLNYNNNPLLGQIPTSTQILTGAASNEKFLQTIFSLAQDELSEPLVLGKNVLVVKMIEETEKDSTLADQNNFMNTYYPFTFDQTALDNHFMESKDLENNLFSVYLTHFMQQAK